MTLIERTGKLAGLFTQLEETPGRNDKEYLIKKYRSIDKQLSEDLTYCLEVLDGRHKLGYTFEQQTGTQEQETALRAFVVSDASIKELIDKVRLESKTQAEIERVAREVSYMGVFIEPLVNRTWRLGIGKSQLTKQAITPMLAKKFDPNKRPKSPQTLYYVTEKLDGNRCISIYEDGEWKHYSRSGKVLKVEFDMSGLPTQHIYDGEVLSKEQWLNPNQSNFNKTSGVVNNGTIATNLLYVIFDIIDTENTYSYRRICLDGFRETDNVLILPVLQIYHSWDDLRSGIDTVRDSVTERGGEGVMINVGCSMYMQKRTDRLLKYKEVQTMDLKVIDIKPGTGKNEGLVGSLECIATDRETKRVYSCSVGSGLTDWMRNRWASYPDEIIGKIVEVQYFSISQSEQDKGTTLYSLRFPRLKAIREDKQTTSTY